MNSFNASLYIIEGKNKRDVVFTEINKSNSLTISILDHQRKTIIFMYVILFFYIWKSTHSFIFFKYIKLVINIVRSLATKYIFIINII